MSPRISRRGMLALGAGSLIGAPAILRPARAQAKTVYVNSYGGVWETSWRMAFFEPFTAKTGIAIKTVPGVSFAKLKAQVQTRNFRVGRHQSRRRRIRPGGARGIARPGRQGGGQDRSAAAAHGARLRHHQLFARH